MPLLMEISQASASATIQFWNKNDMKKIAFLLLFCTVFSIPMSLVAQTEPEDIALAANEFQDSFYE